MKAGLAVLAAVSALLLSACGSVETPDSEPDLFREYTRSTNVKNDRFPTMDTPEDRLANLAALGSPEQVLNRLMAAFECGLGAGPDSEAPCAVTPAASRAAKGFAGSSGELYGRSIIVKRADGSLELLTLFVARKGDDTRLIDSTGATYAGGLDDFIENNDLLSPDDVIFAPQEITAVAGGSKLVTVYGQPVVNWWPWLIGSLGAVVVLIGGFIVVRRVTARRHEVMEPEPPAL